MPRKRLWLGRHDQELRAKIEPIPEANYDPDKEFLRRFFMRRVGERSLPNRWKTRPAPSDWQREILDEMWDATAGRRAREKVSKMIKEVSCPRTKQHVSPRMISGTELLG